MTTIYVPIEDNDIESLRSIEPLEPAQSTPRLQVEGDTLRWIGG